MSMRNLFTIFFVVFFLPGCANVRSRVIEPMRVMWGSSTTALEKARVKAISYTYQCSLQQCYEAVLALGEDWEPKQWEAKEGYRAIRPTDETTVPVAADEEVITPKFKKFTVFIDDRKKHHIVVIHVPGSVETTEVGIFFDAVNPDQTKIDISSLSTNAKLTISRIISEELPAQYAEVTKQ